MKSKNYCDYIVFDVLAEIPGIASRAMFGGFGIYKDGKIFAIIVDDELYFKVDDSNRSDFENFGSHPFTYGKKDGKSATMSYWLVPEEIVEDRERLYELVGKSMMIKQTRVSD